MDGYDWTIERQVPGGTEADWYELCRCDDEAHVSAVVLALLTTSKPPEVIRIRKVPVGL